MNRCSPTPTTHQLCLQNHTIDTTVFPSGSPSYILCQQIDTTSPSHSFCALYRSCSPSNIYEHQISISFLTSTWAIFAYLHPELLTRQRFSATSAATRSRLGMAFIYGSGCIQHRHRDREWHIFAPPHMLCSLFRLLPPCHSAQVPSLTYHINF